MKGYNCEDQPQKPAPNKIRTTGLTKKKTRKRKQGVNDSFPLRKLLTLIEKDHLGDCSPEKDCC